MNAGAPALLGALRGPLMLMTLGILLTAHRFTDITFGKTWPVLLIVFGLIKLLQRLSAPAVSSGSSSPGTPFGAGRDQG